MKQTFVLTVFALTVGAHGASAQNLPPDPNPGLIDAPRTLLDREILELQESNAILVRDASTPSMVTLNTPYMYTYNQCVQWDWVTKFGRHPSCPPILVCNRVVRFGPRGTLFYGPIYGDCWTQMGVCNYQEEECVKEEARTQKRMRAVRVEFRKASKLAASEAEEFTYRLEQSHFGSSAVRVSIAPLSTKTRYKVKHRNRYGLSPRVILKGNR